LIRFAPDSGFNLIGIKAIFQNHPVVAKNLRLEGTSAFRSPSASHDRPPGIQSNAGTFVPADPILATCRVSGFVSGAGRCRTAFRPQNPPAAILESWRAGLFIPLQLAPSPMRLFVLRIELANVVTVQSLHDADPGEHRRASVRLRRDPVPSPPCCGVRLCNLR
jgi:hypothetical protein